MRQDNFKDRYAIKLVSSIFLMILNGGIQLLLPKAFTVEEYGYYSYNLNVFTSIVVMSTLSMPSALISKFSKRNEEIGLVYFYLKFFLIIAIVLNLSVLFLYYFQFIRDTFAGQTLLIVMLGLETVIILRLQTDCIGLFDAMAITRYAAFMQIIMKIVLVAILFSGYLLGLMNLLYFYIMQSFVVLSLTVIMLHIILKEQKVKYPHTIDQGWKIYLKEFYDFCRPLVTSNIISQLLIILMNWSLIRWAGATEQAIYGVAWQLNSLVSYVFSPYAELLKREFAIVSNDVVLLRARFMKSLQMIIWLTSYFALFIGFSPKWILSVLYGNKYNGAELVTTLIMLYTVYQSWGQITGSFLLAMEKTKVNAILSIGGQAITCICVFVFQIPNVIWSDGLGSIGIALNYMVSNFISVCISVIVISKMLNLSWLKVLSIQIFPIALCTGITIILRCGLDLLWGASGTGVYIVKVILAGCIYTFIVGGIILKKPDLVGISRNDLQSIIKIRK